jgi:hypothetical protein
MKLHRRDLLCAGTAGAVAMLPLPCSAADGAPLERLHLLDPRGSLFVQSVAWGPDGARLAVDTPLES